jgi:hypothetical protein
VTEQSGGGGTFNIGSQQAGAIYQSAGDQVIHHGEGTLHVGVLNAVADLRSAVEAANLAPADRETAARSLDAVEEELKKEEPDKGRIAGALEWVTGALTTAGALATAIQPLTGLAGWLGAAGVGLVKMLR